MSSYDADPVSLKERIKESHLKPDDSELQQNLIRDCVIFFSQIPDSEHLYCNAKISAIPIYLILLFAFPDSDPLTLWKEKTYQCLSTCPNCIREFHKQRTELFYDCIVKRKLYYKNANEITNLLLGWESQKLLESLQVLLSLKMSNDFVVTNDQNSSDFQILLCLLQCFHCPQLLRISQPLKNVFLNVFNSAFIEKKITFFKHLIPSIFFFLFEGNEFQRQWAIELISKLYINSQNTKENLINNNQQNITDIEDNFMNVPSNDQFSSDVMDEFYYYFYKLQDPVHFSDNYCILFWANTVPVLRLASADDIINKFNSPISLKSYQECINFRLNTLVNVLTNQLFSYIDIPLPLILRGFNMLLTKLESKFWPLVQPHDYKNFFDVIHLSPHYNKYLNTIPICKETNFILREALIVPYFQDLINWSLSVYMSLQNTQKSFTGCIIYKFFVDKINNPNYGYILGEIGFRTMIESLSLNRSLYDPNLTLEIVGYADSRALLDNKAISIFDAISSPKIDDLDRRRPTALLLLKKILTYDVTSLAQFSHLLSKGDFKANISFYSDIWSLLATKVSNNDIEFVEHVFKSLPNMNCVFSIDLNLLTKKISAVSSNSNVKDEKMISQSKKLIDMCKKHNSNVTMLVLILDKIFTKLSQHYNNIILRKIISSQSAANGFWSCILSPDEKVYEATVGLLYDIYDVEGRLEATKEALKSNMIIVLNSVELSLNKLVALELYIPSKRGVRVLMDFINILFDPIQGLLIGYKCQDKKSQKDLIVFWERCWKFLTMIYKTTFKWSNEHDQIRKSMSPESGAEILNSLREFTRDTLDLSNSMLDSFKMLTTTMQGEFQDTERDVFKIISKAISEMIKWLRLNDSALLMSCFNLIVDTFDLALELNFEIDEHTLIALTKLCSKAKGFNNNLNEQQRGEILLRARKFNEDLVNDTISLIDNYKKMTSGANRDKSSSASMTPEVITIDDDSDDASTSKPKRGSSIEYVSFKKKNQSSITKFMNSNNLNKSNLVSENDEQPTKRMSMLEMAKFKLMEKRKQDGNGGYLSKDSTSSTSPEPAPARPSGFNKKKHNENDSDSDESEDEENEPALFVSKEEREMKMKQLQANLKIQSLQGKSTFHRPNNYKPVVNQKQRAEELMRLRLNVDMNPFYSKVLTWSFSRSDDFPDDEDKSKYLKIKNKFSSASEYTKTFEPLLLLECWQAIHRAKQIQQESPFKVVIGSRSSTDNFFDVYSSVRKEIITEQKKISDSDLLVLALVPSLCDDEPRVRDVLSANLTCLAKVREIKHNANGFSDITLRVSANSKLTQHFTPGSELVGMKVMQMITIEREYSSLVGLQYYDLANDIITATPRVVDHISQARIDEMKRIYNVNDSQANAIAGTVDNDGFSLIQGPPGTGKTKTILGIVGYFLTSFEKKMNASNITQPVNNMPPRKKILICAPSNAAVDELVLRIRGGIKNSKGIQFQPKVVRLGRSDAINSQVKDLTLEELVDKELSSSNEKETAAKMDAKMKEEHKSCIKERDELRNKLNDSTLLPEEIMKLESRLQEVIQKRKELGRKLDEQREKISVSHRNREIQRRNVQFRILSEAQVVCSTLSGSAHDVLASMTMSFDTVVVDEAAQCIELSAIIPLRYGAKKCIMVGDPNQLPPTVLSQKAASYNYEQSLFVRMQNNYKDNVYLLDVQYRMHPDISRFPSKEFYNSKLLDGPNMAEINKRPWHNINIFTPYKFFDIKGKQEQNQQTMSLYNRTEAKIATEMVSKLFNSYPDENWSSKIGIISPYKEQVRCLRDSFIREFGFNITKEIDFNTVDGFQGQEKEIIIFSCVRGSDDSGIGFLSDVRRMNVALTRARTSMWILGSKSSLVQNRTWRDLISDAESREMTIDAYNGFTRDKKIEKITKKKLKLNDYSSLKSKNVNDEGTKKSNGYLPPKPKSSGVMKKLDQTKERSISISDSYNGGSRISVGPSRTGELSDPRMPIKRNIQAERNDSKRHKFFDDDSKPKTSNTIPSLNNPNKSSDGGNIVSRNGMPMVNLSKPIAKPPQETKPKASLWKNLPAQSVQSNPSSYIPPKPSKVQKGAPALQDVDLFKIGGRKGKDKKLPIGPSFNQNKGNNNTSNKSNGNYNGTYNNSYNNYNNGYNYNNYNNRNK